MLSKKKSQGAAPQDYVIFHKARTRVRALCAVSEPGRVITQSRNITIFVDKPTGGQSNEDPFVWTDKWLYSYCIASLLRRMPRADAFVKQGSRIFFCDRDAALEVEPRIQADTVFVVGEAHCWAARGRTVPTAFARAQDNIANELWSRHFRHGVRPRGVKGHNGFITYSAEHFGATPSFLPLAADGNSMSLLAREVLPEPEKSFESRIPNGRSSYPLRLSAKQGETLYRKFFERSAIRVMRVLGPATA